MNTSVLSGTRTATLIRILMLMPTPKVAGLWALCLALMIGSACRPGRELSTVSSVTELLSYDSTVTRTLHPITFEIDSTRKNVLMQLLQPTDSAELRLIGKVPVELYRDAAGNTVTAYRNDSGTVEIMVNTVTERVNVTRNKNRTERSVSESKTKPVNSIFRALKISMIIFMIIAAIIAFVYLFWRLFR